MSTLSRVIFDPDTTPPPVPSNVTGTPFSSTRIDLAWAASVDTGGSGTIGYLVFRNGTQVGTASATAFSDTGLTASTTYTYRVAAVDAAGNVSAQSSQLPVTTQANVGPPVFAPVQPAVAFVGIAGVRTYTDPTQQAAIGRYNLFVMGASWEGWAASGRDLDVIAKAIKAASVAPGGMLLLNYQNLNAIEEDSNDPYPTWTAEVAARNWRLYVSGSAGSLVTPNSGGGATALVNYTTFVPLNPSLEYPYDFGAKYSYYKFLSKTKSDARFSGLAAGLASSTLDGVYQDNFLVNPQVNGDWNRDGTTEGQGWPSTETPWLQAGQLRYCLTMRALAPTKYIFVNGGDYGLVTPGVMSQQADGMLAESYMGKYWSWETQRGFTVMLGYYYKVLAAAASPHLVVFGGSWPDTNPDGSALTRLPTANGYPPLNTQWQWARYIAATALLGEGMHAINRLSQGYSSDLTALDWYDFDGGVNGLARGWLGAPVDALRPTTPKIAKGTIGIYGVEYQNGMVLANPVGNGTQTVVAADIPGSWKFLTGTQDATRDSGATFASVSLPERDGLFLQRVGGSGFLAAGHWQAAKMPLLAITPRPDSETGSFAGTVYARHRLWYYDGTNPIQGEHQVDVQGGAHPHVYQLIAGPSWLSVGRSFGDPMYGVLYGTPTAAISKASPATVTVRVTGQDQINFVDVTFTIATSSSTADFIFADAVNGVDTNSGAIGSKLKTLAKIMGTSAATTTFPGARVYLASGTYQWPLHSDASAPSGGYCSLDRTKIPIVYMAMPGASVNIDASQAQLIESSGGMSDTWFGGHSTSTFSITGSSATASDTHTFEIYNANRVGWYLVKFVNPINRANGSNTNSSSIFTSNSGILKSYYSIWGCSETGRSGAAGNSMLMTSMFSVQNVCMKFCTISGQAGFGVFFKDSNINVTAAYNSIQLLPEATSNGTALLAGCQHANATSANIEFCYNFVRGGGIVLDFQGFSPAGIQWSYRNTICDQNSNYPAGMWNFGPSGTGPYSSENDVIVSHNNIYGSPTPLGGLAMTKNGTEAQLVWSGSFPPANCPVNTTTGALVNSTTAWRNLYLGTRGWEIG